MPQKRVGHSGDKAVTLLATCVVLLGGGLSCAFVILTSAKEVGPSLWICAGAFIGLSLLLWLFREKPNRHSPMHAAWFWFRRGITGDQALHYEIRKRRRKCERGEDQPAPPTVESVRDMANSPNTWVPSSSRQNESSE